MEGNDIKLSLDKICKSFFGDCSFSLVESENMLAFSENRSFPSVNILAGIIIRGYDSSGNATTLPDTS